VKAKIYDPLVKAYREVEMTEEDALKYIERAKELEQKLQEGGEEE